MNAKCYGAMAEFDNENALLMAIKRVRRDYRCVEVYSPWPVEGMEEVLDLPPDRMPFIVLVGALLGGIGTFALEMYSAVIDYPINVGGRPSASWQAFIPPAIEMMALCAVIFGVMGMLLLNRLPQLYHPVFNVKNFERASCDHFFLVVRQDDESFDLDACCDYLCNLEPAPLSVGEVPA